MADRLRVLTFNLLTLESASGRERHDVVRRLLPDLRPDVVALQEVTRSPDLDQAVDLLGPQFTIVDLPGWTPHHVGECLACRWLLGEVFTLDRPLEGHEGGAGCRGRRRGAGPHAGARCRSNEGGASTTS